MTKIEPRGPAGAFVMRKGNVRPDVTNPDRNDDRGARKTARWHQAVDDLRSFVCFGLHGETEVKAQR